LSLLFRPVYELGMADAKTRLLFSQRNGLRPLPPQLKVGEASPHFRRLVDYSFACEIDRVKRLGPGNSYFSGDWKIVAMDFHVKFLEASIHSFENNPERMKLRLRKLSNDLEFDRLFGLIEFFVQHDGCSVDLHNDLANAFVDSKMAYRLIDEQVIAIGLADQGAAVERAIAQADTANALAARTHLIAAGAALRNSNWAGSIRESVHAVEAMARRLVPNAATLGPALNALEKKGHLHGSLKTAFGALYGYTSDEEGVRHSLVFQKEAQVDEADALFMLGVCASFVSYLLTREAQTS
jgi:hypothetical protein